jgi:transcriptional regulator with XRE-family HTH domain
MESTEAQTLARNILKLRKGLQLTQRDLADAIGANQAMVARWESGQTEPRSTTLEKIAQVFQVSPEELRQPNLDLKRALQLTQDPELNRLLTEVPEFEDKDREALKIFLEAISFKNRMRNAFQRA